MEQNCRVEVDSKTYWLFFFRAFLTKKQKVVLASRIRTIMYGETEKEKERKQD